MIRFLRLTPALLDAWLIRTNLPNAHGRYRLRLWRENRPGLAAIRAELIAYIDETFDDARMRIRAGFADDLSPFDDPAHDPAANYPALLHRVTLQGYFGETLAALAIEHWGAHGRDDWAVPALLFRFHDQEFQHLELINERILDGQPYDPDAIAEQRPGRTGDDALAFRISEEGVITDILALEAKCLTQNSPGKIADAHQKLAEGGVRPPGVRELINLLNDYDTPEAEAWQQALLELWHDGYRTARRQDGVSYACGHSPVRPAERVAWMPADAPHPAYTVDRNLEGMEFQFEDLNSVINVLYRGA